MGFIIMKSSGFRSRGSKWARAAMALPWTWSVQYVVFCKILSPKHQTAVRSSGIFTMWHLYWVSRLSLRKGGTPLSLLGSTFRWSSVLSRSPRDCESVLCPFRIPRCWDTLEGGVCWDHCMHFLPHQLLEPAPRQLTYVCLWFQL